VAEHLLTHWVGPDAIVIEAHGQELRAVILVADDARLVWPWAARVRGDVPPLPLGAMVRTPDGTALVLRDGSRAWFGLCAGCHHWSAELRCDHCGFAFQGVYPHEERPRVWCSGVFRCGGCR
jgi:hypothetical protein